MGKILLFSLLALVCGVYSDCSCDFDGSIGSALICNEQDDGCACKPSVRDVGSCDTCYSQFWGIGKQNVFGCTRCSCDLGGSLSQECDARTGACRCKEGVIGRDCEYPAEGYYIPTLYHTRTDLSVPPSPSFVPTAQIGAVLDPAQMSDIPERLHFLLREYPVPVSLEEGNLRLARNFRPSSRPIQPREDHFRAKRESHRNYESVIEFPRPGVYFLVLNYTSAERAAIEVFLGGKEIPVLLPAGDDCLIILAGELGVKGVEVTEKGKIEITISAPESTKLYTLIALPKEYYFAASLRQDVAERCLPGPFTQLCNKYRFPEWNEDYNVVEAENWLSPVTQPAYTNFSGVILHGSDSNDFTTATNTMEMHVQVTVGGRYYVIVNYYRPPHYSNSDRTYSIPITFGDYSGRVELLPCPWETGCRAVVTRTNRKPKIFRVEDMITRLVLSVNEDVMVFLDSIAFVPDFQWNTDLLQPQFYCVLGPEDVCLPGEFPDLTDHVFYESESAIDAVKTTLNNTFYHGTGVLLLHKNAPSLSLVVMGDTMPEKGRYVAIVHYNKYTPGDTSGQIQFYDKFRNSGDVTFSYCPSVSGCRAALTLPEETTRMGVTTHNPSWWAEWAAVEVSGGSDVIIIKLSLKEADLVYVDYLSLVREEVFYPDLLFPLPLDHGPIFTKYCLYQYLYLSPEPALSEYCNKTVFTMTTSFNNGTLECGCSEEGSKSRQCDKLTGQCQCRTGFTGQRCNLCEDGHFGYPLCNGCQCEGENVKSDTCNEETGQCDCKENFGGRDCSVCQDGFYGSTAVGSLTCDRRCGCDVQGSEGSACNSTTGECRCRANVAGDRCDVCEDGRFRFPACYPCDCYSPGSLSSNCEPATGSCTCKEGYTGPKCSECTSTFYRDGSLCLPCPCSGLNTSCTSEPFYPASVQDEFQGGEIDPGYALSDGEGRRLAPGERLATIRYKGDPSVLMVDLSAQDNFTFLELPSTFLGEWRVDSGMNFTFDLMMVSSGDTLVNVMVYLEGSEDLLVYEREHFIVGPLPKVEISLTVSVALFPGSLDWRDTADPDLFPPVTGAQMARAMANLKGIRIQTHMFQGQVTAMIDNIRLDYLSREPPADPVITEVRHLPVCDCTLGYEGDHCQLCDSAHYRDPATGRCDRPCECNGRSETCDDEGVCQDCEDGSEGERCEECSAGFYQDPTSRSCLPCPCSTTGNFRETECEVSAESGEVVCTRCEEGYEGERCEECSNGYHGYKICEECPCSGNLNLTQPDACNTYTGRCNVCVEGVTGAACDRCALGYFGNALEHSCEPCECYEDGSISRICDSRGRCRCRNDVQGDKCDECEDGSYVLDGRCVPCNCDMAKSMSRVCDMRTGQCECEEGWGGRECSVCEAGYRQLFGTCQECGCSDIGSIDGTCNGEGVCACQPGYYGDQCEKCTGHHVSYSNDTCLVCDGCPAILLDQLFSLNNTVQGIKGGVIASTNLPHFEKLREEAEALADSITTPETLTDLLRKARKLRDKGEELGDTADEMMPEALEVFADASDLARAAALPADNVTQLEDELKGIIEDLNNFNLDPDVADNDALERAGELLAEIKARDVSDEPAQAALDAARAVNDSVAALPTLPDLPTVEPLPERIDGIQDHLEGVREALENATDTVGLLNNKLLAVTQDERKVEKKERQLGKAILDVKSSLPDLDNSLDDLSETVNSFPSLNTAPLALIIDEEKEALEDLTPLARPRSFNCSALREVEAPEDSETLQQMLNVQRDVDKLRALVGTLENTTETLDGAVGELEEEIGEREEKAFLLKNITLPMLKLGLRDLKSHDGLGDDLAALQEGLEEDQDRLDNVTLPLVNIEIPGPVPNATTSTPDFDALADRANQLEPPDRLFDVSEALPELLNKTKNAMDLRNGTSIEIKKIGYKLKSLRDKIEKAKRQVETILIPMKFTGDDSYAQYERGDTAQSNFLSISVTVKPLQEEGSTVNGGVLSMGTAERRRRRRRQSIEGGADYVEIGIADGKVTCSVNVDNSVIQLTHEGEPVRSNEWAIIHLKRIGQYITLAVNDSSPTTASLNTTSALNAPDLVIGRTESLGSLKGAITDVYIDGARVAQWLTEELAGVNRSVWANRAIMEDHDVYFLNGDSSYLAYTTPRGSSSTLRMGQVKFSTASEDGLIMFYADGSEEEGNLDVFAIDLHEGNLRLHYTDENSQLNLLEVAPSPGNSFSDLVFKEASALLVAKSRRRQASLKVTGEKATETLLSDGFSLAPQMQYTYFGRVPPSVKQKYASVFETVSSNGFIGCINPRMLNNGQLSSSNMVTSRDIINGCPDNMIRDITLKSGGFATLSATAVHSISFSLATASHNGTVLTFLRADSGETLGSASITEGKLAVTFPGDLRLQSSARVNTATRRFIRIDLLQTSALLYVDDVLEAAGFAAAEKDSILGLSVTPSLGVESSNGYAGCIGDLVIGDRVYDFKTDITSSGGIIWDRCRTFGDPPTPDTEEEETIPTEEQVEEAAPTTTTTTSAEMGQMVSSEPTCRTDVTANTDPNSLFLSSTGGRNNYLRVPMAERSIVIKFNISLTVRTRSEPGGVILYVPSTEGMSVILLIGDGGRALLRVEMTDTPLEILSETPLNDGLSHKIMITRDIFKFTLSVDGSVVKGQLNVAGVPIFMLASSGVFIGSVDPSSTSISQNPSFSACVSEIAISGGADSAVIPPSQLVREGNVPLCLDTASLSTSHYFNGNATISPDQTVYPGDVIVIRFSSSRQTGHLVSLLAPDTSPLLTLTLANDLLRVVSGTEDDDAEVGVYVESGGYFFCNNTATVILTLAPLTVTTKVEGHGTVNINLPAILSETEGASLYFGDQFMGCMEDPVVNGQRVSFSNPTSNSGVLLNSCPAA